jgi:hypothetical protein
LEVLDKMRSDEAGAACDEDSHETLNFKLEGEGKRVALRAR